jgi:hypothetical protein
MVFGEKHCYQKEHSCPAQCTLDPSTGSGTASGYAPHFQAGFWLEVGFDKAAFPRPTRG